jgi:DNA-binding MarR family transcriptional regulator
VPVRAGKAKLVTELVLEVFHLNGRLLRAGDELTEAVGLSSARWQVLGAVAERPLSMAAIARRIGRARQSVREIAAKLVADGFVELTVNDADRRAPLVYVTQEGHALLHELAPLQVRWATELGGQFRIDELFTALKVLQRLDERLSDTRRAAGE